MSLLKEALNVLKKVSNDQDLTRRQNQQALNELEGGLYQITDKCTCYADNDGCPWCSNKECDHCGQHVGEDIMKSHNGDTGEIICQSCLGRN